MPGATMRPLKRPLKDDLGRTVPISHRELMDRVSQAINSSASGEEAAIEDAAIREGAKVLFDQEEDGFVSALAIMLIPRELKDKSRRIAAVAQPFGFVCRLSRRERLAVITPSGYVTDFASIPSAVHFVISPFGKHAEAAVVHDWLYTLGTPGDRKGRRMADKAFVKALRLLNVHWFKRQIMYWAVRFGGAGGYGLATDFAFRNLHDLTVVDLSPQKLAYMTTFATAEIPKARKKAAKQAVATEVAGEAVSGTGEAAVAEAERT
jgi:hypothetical protein